MKENIPLYLLTCAMLGEAIYLHSPFIAVAIVALWAVKGAEHVMSRKNRDADLSEILATLAAHKAQMSILTKDVVNVAERAKNILGENY